MVTRTLTAIVSIFIIFLLSFLIWHFFLSIYEVKYLYEFPGDKLRLNSEYYIECVGLNSLGWEIKYRDLENKFEIQNGVELIELLNSKLKNQFLFIPKRTGNFTLIASSKYSLNPTQFNFTIIDKLENP